jgi:hypothetical protein
LKFRKYLWRGTIFSFAGVVGAVLELLFLWLLTQAGIWYMYSAMLGHVIGGIVVYNLNIVSGNISVAAHKPKALGECGCTVDWNLVCPQCGNCLQHCTCAG